MRAANALVMLGWLGAAVACAAAGTGCSSGGTGFRRPVNESAFTSTSPALLAAARIQAMAAADTYATIVAQATDELRAKTTRDEVREWAMQQRIAAALASYTNATGSNDFVALLDMMVLATLKRQAVEDHWIPTLLHEEGAPLLEALRRGEHDVWGLGAKVVTEPQRTELRRVIDEWRQANPTQFYVSHIRFTDFANAMRITSGSPQVKLPTSVFSLLYIDPLAGLDPVARELAQYRALTERMVYLANRMPIVLGWQVDLLAHRTTNGPQVVRFVDSTSKFADSTSKFADATTRFTDAVVKFPQELTTERTAAIKQLDAATTQQVKGALEQVFAGVTQQRQAMVRDIEAQESRARAIIADVRGVVERADEAGRSLNAATGQTVDTTERSARRLLYHAFALAVALLVIVALVLLSYRFVVKRWALHAMRVEA